MNGKHYQRTISAVYHSKTLVRVLEILLLLGAGMIAIMLHVRFRTPFNIPGHHGLEFMAILMLARVRSNLRFATSISSLGVGLLLLFPVFGFSDPMAGFNYMLPGIILDILYISFPGERKNIIFIGIIAGLAYVSIPFSRLLIHLSTGYPYGTFIKFGYWGPLLSFFSFGMIGGIIGLGADHGARKLKSAFLSSLVILMAFSSCTEKDPDYSPPELYLNADQEYVCQDTVLSAGENFKCGVLAYGVDLTNFHIKAIIDGQEQMIFDTGIHVNSLDWSKSFIKGLGLDEQWTYTVTDKEGNSASYSITFLLDSGSSYQPVDERLNVTLGAQDNNTNGSFYSIQENSVYDLTQLDQDPVLQATIDLVYYFYGTDENVIASPGANIEDGVFPGNLESWTNTNTTRYIKTDLSVEEFNAISNDSTILANYTEGDGKRKAKNLTVDDIYSFKINSEKLGIFLVKEVNGTTDGSVMFDIKIQQ